MSVIAVMPLITKLAQETVGKIFQRVIVSLVGVGVGNSSPGTDCSIFFVWSQTVVENVASKAKFAKRVSMIIVLLIRSGTMATTV